MQCRPHACVNVFATRVGQEIQPGSRRNNATLSADGCRQLVQMCPESGALARPSTEGGPERLLGTAAPQLLTASLKTLGRHCRSHVGLSRSCKPG